MKVYVLQGGSLYDYPIHGVFTSLEKAQAFFRAKYPDNDPEVSDVEIDDIEEYELDPALLEESEETQRQCSSHCSSGEVIHNVSVLRVLNV